MRTMSMGGMREEHQMYNPELADTVFGQIREFTERISLEERSWSRMWLRSQMLYRLAQLEELASLERGTTLMAHRNVMELAALAACYAFTISDDQ